ncbi:hypothetical protein K2173_017821 [Erythroxylum novogranatense]|uniref:FRIGIDA-like protein n=1 Tax=Erythroxylum novogranatense TaxID=1862640 RepID=A0AAV8T385_9ROSI|nr:hypothetical protein K2173_017821 [Erythroxylum novogranatense]
MLIFVNERLTMERSKVRHKNSVALLLHSLVCERKILFYNLILYPLSADWHRGVFEKRKEEGLILQMEKAMDELREAKTKRESLCKLFDQAHSQASSIVAFALQVKDVNSKLVSAQEASFLEEAQELSLQEKKLVEAEKQIEERKKEAESKLDRDEKYFDEIGLLRNQCDLELSLAQKDVEKCNAKLSFQREQLGLGQKMLDDCNDELDVKIIELSVLREFSHECAMGLDLKKMEMDTERSKVEECRKEHYAKEEKLNSVQKSLQECSKELEFTKKEAERVMNLAKDSQSELESKEKELYEVKNLIEIYENKLELKNNELEMLQKKIQDSCAELAVKGMELDAIQKSVDECQNEVDLKKMELCEARELNEEQMKVFDLKKKELAKMDKLINERSNCLDSIEMRLNSTKLLIEEYDEELEVKEKRHNMMTKSIDQCCEQLKLKETELERLNKSIEDHSGELHSLKKKLDLVQKQRMKCDKELESKETMLNEMKETLKSYRCDIEMKEREFNVIRSSNEELKLKEDQLKSVQVSIEECSRELNTMREEKASVQESIMSCSQELTSNKKNLDMARKNLKEFLYFVECKRTQLDSILITFQKLEKKLEDTEKHFDSLNKMLQDRLEHLEMKQRQLEEHVKVFESKEQQIDSTRELVEERCKELEKKLQENFSGSIFSSQVRTGQMEHEQLSNPVSELSRKVQASAATDMSSEFLQNECIDDHELAPNEILTALHVSPDPAKLVLTTLQASFSYHRKNNTSGFDSSHTRNIVLLLEQLMMVSPSINPQVKEAATNLAMYWKDKTRLDTNNSSEVLAFLLFLGTYQLVHLFNMDEIIRLAGIILQHNQAPELCVALGFRDQIPHFIRHLYQGKQFVAAARFSCVFGLLGEFPPENFLNAFLNNVRADAWDSISVKSSKEAQHQAAEKELTALRAILECIIDYELQTRFVTDNILSRIAKLEKLKIGRVQSIPYPDPIIRSQTQGAKCFAAGSSAPEHRNIPGNIMGPGSYVKNLGVVQDKFKRPRIDMSSVPTYPLQFMYPLNPSVPSVSVSHQGVAAQWRHNS